MSDQTTNSNPIGKWLWGPFSRTGFFWALIAFAIDQFHKWWLLNITGITTSDRIIVTSFFDIILVWNKGISYGSFQQDSLAGSLLLAAGSFLGVVALAVWLARAEQTRLTAIAIGLVMGGGLGNILDRLIRPGVADFFSLHAYGFQWFIFNVADIAIVAGVVALLYDALFIGPKTASKPSQD